MSFYIKSPLLPDTIKKVSSLVGKMMAMIDPYNFDSLDLDRELGDLEDQIMVVNSEYPKIMAHVDMVDDLMSQTEAAFNLEEFAVVNNFEAIRKWCALNIKTYVATQKNDVVFDMGIIILHKDSASQFVLRWHDDLDMARMK